jgi:aspartyl-tRNA(Asn)/glutamyl-tRNA(Gln) amidotransferase subunit C
VAFKVVTLSRMSDDSATRLSDDAVRKVARLSRLELSEDAIHTFAEQLTSVLSHIAKIKTLDLEGVEPMAHPLPITNRLDDDEPIEGMGLRALLANAPAVEGDFIAVPKVLDGSGGGA